MLYRTVRADDLLRTGIELGKLVKIPEGSEASGRAGGEKLGINQ